MRILPILTLALCVTPTAVLASDICAPKRFCTQIKTCGEAHYRLTVCLDIVLDRDRDGVPCEDMCGKTISSMSARIAAEPFQPPEEAVANAVADVGTSEASTASGEDLALSEPVNFLAQCGTKRTRGQMLSCAEAMYHLQSCGMISLDGNGHGVPCNGCK